MNHNRSDYTRRVIIAAAVAATALTLLYWAWFLAQILLLLFAGILLAVFTCGLMRPLERHARLPHGAAFVTVVLALLGLVAGSLLQFGPMVADGVGELTDTLPQAWERITTEVERHDWLESGLLRMIGGDGGKLFSPQALGRAFGVFSTALGAVTGTAIIVVLGLYLAAEPRLYRNGLLMLIPRQRRERGDEVLAKLAHTLRWWLLGRIASMAVVGLLTWAGLLALGVPLPGVLALVAALLSFVPNVGPVLSAIPAILVALNQGSTLVMWVVGLYIAVQVVESYLITPLIQRRAVSMPPALLFTVQLMLGLGFGVLGLLLATPLAVVAMVLVQMLYVQDVLGEQVELA